MKRLFLALTLLISISASAQVQFGLKAGANFARVTNLVDDEEPQPGNIITDKVTFKFGPHGHLYLVIPFGSGTAQFFFQPEVGFSMKGYKRNFRHEGTNYLQTIVQDVAMGYIDVPLNFKFKPVESFAINFGPYLGITSVVKSKSTTTTTVAGVTNTIEGDDNDKTGIKPTDVGFSAGPAFETPGGLIIGARYSHGFITIAAEADADEKAYLNSNIQVYLGFTIGGNAGGGGGKKGRGGYRR